MLYGWKAHELRVLDDLNRACLANSGKIIAHDIYDHGELSPILFACEKLR